MKRGKVVFLEEIHKGDRNERYVGDIKKGKAEKDIYQSERI